MSSKSTGIVFASAPAIGKVDPEMTATGLWYCEMAVDGDPGITGFSIFETDPPVRSGQIQKTPKVLVVSTNTESEVVAAAARQAHPNAEIVFSRVAGAGFWIDFFGCADYVGAGSDELHIPTAIVTSGWMRRYAGSAGDTFPAGDRLKEIAERWGIQITFVET